MYCHAHFAYRRHDVSSSQAAAEATSAAHGSVASTADEQPWAAPFPPQGPSPAAQQHQEVLEHGHPISWQHGRRHCHSPDNQSSLMPSQGSPSSSATPSELPLKFIIIIVVINSSRRNINIIAIVTEHNLDCVDRIHVMILNIIILITLLICVLSCTRCSSPS